jgi:hypothetical protein
MGEGTVTQGISRLSTNQVEHYRNQGFLIYRDPVLPPAKFGALKALFEEMLAALDGSIRPEAMDTPHFNEPRLFEWLFADEILGLVEPILGADIALFSSHFVSKPRGDGRRVPWHEDSAYWKGVLMPMEVCTVWLAIDPSTRENGCMKVIPETHQGGYSDYEEVDTSANVFAREIVESQRDESRGIYLELHPNQASLHDGRIMHGSDPNSSELRRCGYTMRYISTRTRFHPEANDCFRHHLIYLARGNDHAGNDYGDPIKAYPELARMRGAQGTKGH